MLLSCNIFEATCTLLYVLIFFSPILEDNDNSEVLDSEGDDHNDLGSEDGAIYSGLDSPLYGKEDKDEGVC